MPTTDLSPQLVAAVAIFPWSFNVIIAIILGVVLSVAGAADESASLVFTIFQLAILIPSIAVGVRRMHDTDHSAW